MDDSASMSWSRPHILISPVQSSPTVVLCPIQDSSPDVIWTSFSIMEVSAEVPDVRTCDPTCDSRLAFPLRISDSFWPLLAYADVAQSLAERGLMSSEIHVMKSVQGYRLPNLVEVKELRILPWSLSSSLFIMNASVVNFLSALVLWYFSCDFSPAQSHEVFILEVFSSSTVMYFLFT